MGSLLPVLQAAIDPMQLCSICPEPGRCCKKFCLPDAPPFWRKTWREDALHWVGQHGLPFEPHSHGQVYRDDSGKEYVLVWFGCPKVTDEGRCSIYEQRPDTCRAFTPASDALCVFHPDAARAYQEEPQTEWKG